MPPKRVLFVEVTADGTVGGSHHCLLEVVKHLGRERFSPLVLFYEDHILVPEFEKVAPVLILPPSRGFAIQQRFPRLHQWASRVGPLWWLILLFQKGYNLVTRAAPSFFRVGRLLVRERIDLVCINNAPFFNDWLTACKLLGRPCVSYFRGTPTGPIPGVQRRLVAGYDAVLSISNAVTEQARRQGIGVSNFVLIYDGIDAAAVRSRAATPREDTRKAFLQDLEQPLIGVVNNIRHWKGQHVAVEAMRILHARRPDVVCLLVGNVAADDDDRRYFERLKTSVAHNGLEEVVIFTGFRRDVPDLLVAMDVVLHTSLSNEGFPRIILEAMILGRPVIASQVGPSAEMLEDGVSGFLIPPDDPTALADRIEKVLADPDRRLATGIRARERAERLFSIETNIRKTEALFGRILRV